MSATNPHKVETYVWHGRDAQGKKVNGEIQAVNPILAKAELRQRRINSINIRRKSRPLFSFGGRISPTDMTVFSRQLATMINSGVPVVQALDVISGGIDKASLRDMIIDIKNDVSGGSQLASAMAKYPRQFDNLFRSLVHVGEESGTLDAILLRLSDYMERMKQVKSKIRKAMVYPVTVFTIAILLTIFMLVKVVPSFENLYGSFGNELPSMTRTVIAISEFMQAWWLVFIATFGLSVFAVVYSYNKSLTWRVRFTRLVLRLPLLGGIIKKAAVARFSRTLSTMFTAGVPLVNSMDSVADAVSNEVYKASILDMRDSIATGEQLHTSMRQYDSLYPSMVTQMIAIGEESGSLDGMLAKVADFYEEEVNNSVDTLSTLMEPLIMIILGAIVGGLVLAMYLPIFQMGSMLR
ncbi:MAG: type II secretion system F family protein [Gammaproteobacteria bacterium]|nr:type II secretion system F family protein [Gammaproteobacteria bacterium]